MASFMFYFWTYRSCASFHFSSFSSNFATWIDASCLQADKDATTFPQPARRLSTFFPRCRSTLSSMHLFQTCECCHTRAEAQQSAEFFRGSVASCLLFNISVKSASGCAIGLVQLTGPGASMTRMKKQFGLCVFGCPLCRNLAKVCCLTAISETVLETSLWTFYWCMFLQINYNTQVGIMHFPSSVDKDATSEYFTIWILPSLCLAPASFFPWSTIVIAAARSWLAPVS